MLTKDTVTRVQIQEKAVSILKSANTLGKGIYPTILQHFQLVNSWENEKPSTNEPISIKFGSVKSVFNLKNIDFSLFVKSFLELLHFKRRPFNSPNYFQLYYFEIRK